ncbi:MAG TPA: amino acid ABC transporter substrate-binding protein [Burkholderiales bacterium]|nr:amino acid ABC transporter substrate-binding protein [Burkholderiales bacterium]
MEFFKQVSVVAAVAIGLAASPASADQPTGTLKKIIDTRKIRLGYQRDLAPLSSIGADGKPRGYSIDLCRRVVSGIRNDFSLVALDIEWVEVTMTSRFKLVADGSIDLECAASAITLSRMKMVDFSAMTWIDSGTFLARRGEVIRSIADLGGKKVAVFEGSTTEGALRGALLGQTLAGGQVSTQIVLVKNRQGSIEALDAGAVDMIAGDRTILANLARSARDPEQLALADYQFMYEPYGLPLRRNDADFKFAVNSALANLYSGGEILKIYKAWFGDLTPPPLLESLYDLNGLRD